MVRIVQIVGAALSVPPWNRVYFSPSPLVGGAAFLFLLWVLVFPRFLHSGVLH